MTRMYFERLRYSEVVIRQDRANMQPRIQKTSAGHGAIPGTEVSYTTAAEDFKHVLTEAGIEPSGFGEHSARRGGATAAAAAGVDWLDLKRHGRWKSDKAAQAYVDEHEKNNDRAAVALARTVSAGSSDMSETNFGKKSERKKTIDRRTHSAARRDRRSSQTVYKHRGKTFKYEDELKYEASVKRRAKYKY